MAQKKNHNCPKCEDKSYRTKEGLERHMKREHTDPLIGAGFMGV